MSVEIFVTSPPTSASVGVSTDGAGSPGQMTLASVWTSKLKGIVCSGDPGAEVLKAAIQEPAVGNVAWVTYTPTAPSIAQMKTGFSPATFSPFGPVNASSTVRSGFAIGSPAAVWNPNRIRFSPTISSREIITG